MGNDAKVLVIGTIFVDCKGFARDEYNPDARNLGKIKFFHGGVARNVAENMAKLNLQTTLMASADATPLGKDVIERLEAAKVSTKYIKEAKEDGMGMWLAILDKQGSLSGSISQMPDLALLKQTIDENITEIANEFTDIVLELDLNIDITSKAIAIAKEHNKKIYGIPGNLDVILSNPEILKDMDCFICNNFEADRLFETDFTNSSLDFKRQLVETFAKKLRIQFFVVTLGGDGSVYYDVNSKASGYQPVFPVNVVESTGAGDAFFSGTVMGLIKNKPLSEAVICGTKVAGWTIESVENCCEDLSEKIKGDELFRDVEKVTV
ncbi:carbohydrate kinase family protein [Desulfuribacillus alkaliarsenatis]|uniref:Sugar kinase n=1 Tax=Desulfuribacillus alkaliarsenatis TaxID=766136 RepID=A0A1E5G3H7_9FIRM|nr:PfkB family carbohydrate kinase [Desulfuribacillus alkaliarsenatis]OEF97637.1 sugar kinase [Desulfuribacillus alkaliarsenatis]